MAASCEKRFATFDEQQFDEILQNKDAQNTKAATKQAVTIFKKYLMEKGLDVDIQTADRKTAILAIFKRELDVALVAEGIRGYGEKAGAAAIVNNGLVPLLIGKLVSELDEIQELILTTLHYCLLVDTKQALDAAGVSVFKSKLFHSSDTIRSLAAQALMNISAPLEGKEKMCEEDVILVLVDLLSDPNPKVRGAAAGALMFATITTQGKYKALEADIIPPLLILVNDPVSKVRLNAIKTITTMSEAPAGRRALLDHLPLFEGKAQDPSEAVRKAIKIAIEVITWKP